VESLEADDSAPALRRRIADRVAALESSLEERRSLLAKLQQEASQEPATYDDIEAARPGAAGHCRGPRGAAADAAALTVRQPRAGCALPPGAATGRPASHTLA
jgi:hypothetical protein